MTNLSKNYKSNPSRRLFPEGTTFIEMTTNVDESSERLRLKSFAGRRLVEALYDFYQGNNAEKNEN